MNKNMENIFDNVYKNRIWDITTNSISGKGSEPINCQNWNSLLNNIIATNFLYGGSFASFLNANSFL